MSSNNNIKIFSGSSNPVLTEKICKYLCEPVGEAKIERFPDGEKISAKTTFAAGIVSLCSRAASLLTPTLSSF
jgi:phosphoribosylpyrophosphate synthetase